MSLHTRIGLFRPRGLEWGRMARGSGGGGTPVSEAIYENEGQGTRSLPFGIFLTGVVRRD